MQLAQAGFVLGAVLAGVVGTMLFIPKMLSMTWGGRTDDSEKEIERLDKEIAALELRLTDEIRYVHTRIDAVIRDK